MCLIVGSAVISLISAFCLFACLFVEIAFSSPGSAGVQLATSESNSLVYHLTTSGGSFSRQLNSLSPSARSGDMSLSFVSSGSPPSCPASRMCGGLLGPPVPVHKATREAGSAYALGQQHRLQHQTGHQSASGTTGQTQIFSPTGHVGVGGGGAISEEDAGISSSSPASSAGVLATPKSFPT
ncbi:unnamed protein product, partial [Protopolystoma xenopodis]